MKRLIHIDIGWIEGGKFSPSSFAGPSFENADDAFDWLASNGFFKIENFAVPNVWECRRDGSRGYAAQITLPQPK